MKQLHPILMANAILANPLFILALNALFFVTVRFHLVGLDTSDFGMSWVTMFMDQVIISAGWILSVKTMKWQRKIEKEFRVLHKQIQEMGCER